MSDPSVTQVSPEQQKMAGEVTPFVKNIFKKRWVGVPRKIGINYPTSSF